MHAERDHLVRFVFPELKERCRKIHVHLIDVDLRWGVTEKDAQEGKALEIYLDEIIPAVPTSSACWDIAMAMCRQAINIPSPPRKSITGYCIMTSPNR